MASKYDGATLEILAWDKFNPRKDLKATSWFRLQNSLFEDPNFFDFSHAEVMVWIYVLSLASKKQAGSIRISIAHAERIGRFDAAVIEEAFEKLLELQCVQITLAVRNVRVTSTSRPRHTTNERTDETNVTKRTDEKEEIQESGETNAVAVAPADQAIIPKRSKFNPDTRAKMVSFIRTYAEVWKAKYKSNPEGLKDKGLIGKVGHWIEGVSEQRALDLIQVYLQVDYRPINESCHDLWQFFRHLNRIGIAMDTGQDTAGINWAEVFKSTA